MQTVTTITEQIRNNIYDYENSTGKTARDIEISGLALECLLEEDKDSKNTRVINGLLYLDSDGQEAFFGTYVNAFPFSDDSKMLINEKEKYYLEFPVAEETEAEKTQETVTHQILGLISDYECSNGCRPSFIRIDPSFLKYLMRENENNSEIFHTDNDCYVFDGIGMEPTVFPSSNNYFPISLCSEVKYSLRIPR